MREQAALSASEITADTVNDFVADLEDDGDYEEISTSPPQKSKSLWERILMNIEELSSAKKGQEDLVPVRNSIATPKVNGKHNKNIQNISLKVNGNPVVSDGIVEFIHANAPLYKEVVPSLESWKAGKVAMWHNVEGCSVQWLCILCIDRKGEPLLLIAYFQKYRT